MLTISTRLLLFEMSDASCKSVKNQSMQFDQFLKEKFLKI